MKATIDKTGTLTIEAESPLESYALDKRGDENLLVENSMPDLLIKYGDHNYKKKEKKT